MRECVRRDLMKSAKAFTELIWPIMSPWCGGGELLPVETVSDQAFEATLDQLSGIDAWQVRYERGIRGLASRIQFMKSGGRAWASFTIRERRSSGQRTEFEKRLLAMSDTESGYLWPALTIQAYINLEGKVLHCCVCKTRDLYSYCRRNWSKLTVDRKANPDDGNQFLVVWWPDMLDSAHIGQYTPDPELVIYKRRRLSDIWQKIEPQIKQGWLKLAEPAWEDA